MADIVVFFQDQVGEFLKKPARVARPDHERIGFAQVQPDHIAHGEQTRGQVARLAAADKNGKRMFIQEVANLGQGSDGRNASLRHDGHMVGQLFQLFELVTADEQALVPRRQVAE